MDWNIPSLASMADSDFNQSKYARARDPRPYDAWKKSRTYLARWKPLWSKAKVDYQTKQDAWRLVARCCTMSVWAQSKARAAFGLYLLVSKMEEPGFNYLLLADIDFWAHHPILTLPLLCQVDQIDLLWMKWYHITMHQKDIPILGQARCEIESKSLWENHWSTNPAPTLSESFLKLHASSLTSVLQCKLTIASHRNQLHLPGSPDTSQSCFWHKICAQSWIALDPSLPGQSKQLYPRQAYFPSLFEHRSDFSPSSDSLDSKSPKEWKAVLASWLDWQSFKGQPPSRYWS